MRKLMLLASFICSLYAAGVCQVENYRFPQDWLGSWNGELMIYKDIKVVQKVSMEVNHQLTEQPDEYIWTIKYGSDSDSGLRNYRLKVRNRDKGHYVHDEQNSIYLDAWVAGNKLISMFEVEGSWLTSVYERVKEGINFEILVYDKNVFNTSGNTTKGEEIIPEVKTYKLTGYQRAFLTKNAD